MKTSDEFLRQHAGCLRINYPWNEQHGFIVGRWILKAQPGLLLRKKEGLEAFQLKKNSMISSDFWKDDIKLRNQPRIFFQNFSKYLLPFVSFQMHHILLRFLIDHCYPAKNQILKLFKIFVMLHFNRIMKLRLLIQFIKSYTNFYNQLLKNRNSGINQFEFVNQFLFINFSSFHALL